MVYVTAAWKNTISQLVAFLFSVSFWQLNNLYWTLHLMHRGLFEIRWTDNTEDFWQIVLYIHMHNF